MADMWIFSFSLLCVLAKSLQADHSSLPQELEVAEPLSELRNMTWTSWTHCNRNCRQSRTIICLPNDRHCKRHKLRQKRPCWKPRGKCARETRARRFNVRKMGGLEDFVYDLLYEDWSQWSACTRSCIQRRYRNCKLSYWCHDVVLIEERKCRVKGTRCDAAKERPQKGTSSKEDNQGQHRQQSRRPDKNKEKNKEKNKNNRKNQGKLDEAVFNQIGVQCGRRNVTARSLRIVGGQEAQRGAWPWQVAIMTRWKEQYCGGVLISPRHVLTAAHCLRRNGKRRQTIVRTGEYDIGEYEGVEEDFKSPRDVIHPDFDIETVDSDIAIVKLPRSVPLSDDVHYACIPDSTDVLPPRTLCYAIGWGKVGNTRVFGEDVLREAKVPLVDKHKCQSAFEYEITPNQMCAGYRRGGVDSCAGDSGGPLMCEIEKNGQKQWYVYGVTSFGEGCGDRGKYGIYTRVNNFSDWIRTNLRK